MALEFKSALITIALATLGCAASCFGQTPESSAVSAGPPQLTDRQPSGSISGTIVDVSGAVIVGARVVLTRPNLASAPEKLTDDGGRFTFANVEPGPFLLSFTSAGFGAESFSGTLAPGQLLTVPQVTLTVAATVTDVDVSLSAPEVAEAQVKDEEKQRVLRVIPNFFVTYDPHPVALSPKQKFELAWKTSIDPFTLGLIAAIAGVEQSQNIFEGYGKGVQGYAKRFGASYADVFAGTFIGSAILPSVFKQDPRYFYKGRGSKRSRLLYALANSVICKGDNGRWQTNYSNLLGSLAAGGISNLYYPAADRNGARLTFENGLIGIGGSGAANVFQEFFVKKFTPSAASRETGKP